jgi:hypothetical protein
MKTKRFWVILLKIIGLAFVGSMIVVQIPELKYDLGSKKPFEISSVEDLKPETIGRASFVTIAGVPNFDRAFVYQRYGLNYTYFIIEPYGMQVVARTYEKVNEEWNNLSLFVGKLRPFEDQPFSYRIREIYIEQHQEIVPHNAFFLGLDDVPKPSGWQIGAVCFAGTLWGVMFYMFFFFLPRHGIRSKENSSLTM